MKAKAQAQRELVCSIKRAAEQISEALHDLNELGTNVRTPVAHADILLAWVYDMEREDVLYQQTVLREDPPCIQCGAPESVCDC
jgi:hypothetical protein